MAAAEEEEGEERRGREERMGEWREISFSSLLLVHGGVCILVIEFFFSVASERGEGERECSLSSFSFFLFFFYIFMYFIIYK